MMMVRNCSRTVVAVIAGAMFAALASAQVVIDMPPPPSSRAPALPPVQQPAPTPDAETYPQTTAPEQHTPTIIDGDLVTATPLGIAAQQQEVTVGDVALYRFANARTRPYDTYSDDLFYGRGIRVYSYPRFFPQFVWGPFFPFFFHHPFCW